MFDFLENLDVLHRSFWYVALFSSLVFVVQAVLTFIGSDSTDGTAPDFDGDFDGVDAPFQLFSLRNLTNFLLGFGWAGVAFYPMVENKFLLTIIAAAVGVGFVLIFFLVIKQLLKLSEDNTFKINDLKGKTGEVYLKIPAQSLGKGKVLISLKGTNHELYAITNSGTDILSGELIKVVDIKDEILIVEKI